ncbi:MAG: hypothetical protein AAF399_03885 [Bacteroidota bacterium]
MITTFLRAKHWQLFLLLFGIPMLTQLFVMGMMFQQMLGTEAPQPEKMFAFMKFFPFLIGVSGAVLYGWFGSIGLGLNALIPAAAKLKVGRFRFCVWFSFGYLLLLVGFMGFFFAQFDSQFPAIGSQFPYVFLAILPFHFFSMICTLYCLYFVAKTIKTTELQRKVKFSEYLGELIMIWFYPIGIWILQPKLNQMAKELGTKAGVG